MPVHGLLGIENAALNTAVSLLLLVLAVLWLSLVFWTYKDAVRRIADPWLVVTATATSLIFPFIGTVVYLILRPPEFLEDVRERDLEIAAAEARLMQMSEHGCPHCGYPVEKTFLRCPSCLARLREPCATCRKPLDPSWRICPYCEAEIGQAPPQRRRRRAAGATERPRAAEATQRSAAAPGSQSRPPADVPSEAGNDRGAESPRSDGVPTDESTVVRQPPRAR